MENKNINYRQNIRKDIGQTIIEILVAFVLLTFLLTGLSIVGLYTIRNAQFAKNKSLATKYASQQLERVRVVRDTQGILALPSCGSQCYLDNNLVFTTPLLTPTGGFSQTLNIVTPVGNECANPVGIAVTPYKAISKVGWGVLTGATPHQVVLISCFNDWRDK